MSSEIRVDTSKNASGLCTVTYSNTGAVLSGITTGTFSGSGASLTALNGSNIASGTVAAARIDNLSGAKITSGTVAAARIDNLAASKITSGTVATARLGSGTASNSTYLRGDQSWQTISSGPGVGHSYAQLFNNAEPSVLSNTGRNIIIGYNAAPKFSNGTTGEANENVMIGYVVGYNFQEGSQNTLIGSGTGYHGADASGNVGLGAESCRTTGSNNTCIGRWAGNVGGFSGSNNIIIGYNADPTSASTSNEITIGSATNTHFRIPGVGTTITSDGSMGLGTSPEADGQAGTLYFKNGNANIWGSSNVNLYTCVNARYTGSAWRYNNTAKASYVGQQSGVWNFFNAPSGTADDPVTFTERIRIAEDGTIRQCGATWSNNAIRAVLYNPDSTASQAQFQHTGTTTGTSRGFRVGHNGSGGQLWNFENDYVRISTNNTERFRITNTGDFWINTTSSTDGNTSKGLHINSPSGSSCLSMKRGDSGHMVRFINGTTLAGYINSSNTTTMQYQSSSDYRLKENNTTITDGIAKVKQLKPIRFNWKEGSDTTTIFDGFLAHEVQAVVPQAASGVKDATNDDGSVKAQCTSLTDLVPILTAALQEEIAKREALEARIAALESS